MTEKEWRASFRALARLAGIERDVPSAWPEREKHARHVCRVLAFQLDEADGEGRRELARAYARAFGLFVEAARRHADTPRPPPGEP